MKNLDIRIKLLILCILSFLAVFYQEPKTLLILFLTALLLLLFLGVKLTSLCGRLKSILRLLILITLLQSLFTPSVKPLFTLGTLSLLSMEGLYQGATFFLRMLVLICSATILSTSNPREIMQGLLQLHIPYELCLMSTMGFKFIPLLRDRFFETYTAMELRGVYLRKQPLKYKFAIISQILLPVVASSIQSARSVSISLHLRGFRSCGNPTTYYKLSFSPFDYLIGVLSLIYLIGFLLLQGGIL